MEIVKKELPDVEQSVLSTSYITIRDLSKLKTTYTKPIFVRKHFWTIKFSRADHSDEASLKFDFFLQNGQEKANDWAIIAQLSVKVISKKYCQQKLRADSGPQLFDATGESNSHSIFIQWNDLMEPDSGYVMDDICCFKIKLKAGPIQKWPADEYLKFDVEPTFCRRMMNAKLHMTVNNLSEAYGICSPEFSLDGAPWQIFFWKDKRLHIFILNKATVSTDYFRDATINYKLISNGTAADKKKTEKVKFYQTSMEHHMSFLPWKKLWSLGFVDNGSFEMEIQIKIERVNNQENGQRSN